MLKKSIIISLAILFSNSAGAADRRAAQIAARHKTTPMVIYSAARKLGLDLRTEVPVEKAMSFRTEIENLKAAAKLSRKAERTAIKHTYSKSKVKKHDNWGRG